MKKHFKSIAKTSLILVYCVIIAGALVRMTGSGMGCPDWPKCFGYYIPPTDIEQLTWRPGRTFGEGQVIIKDEALWVAKSAFTTGAIYNPKQWRPYTKHDYAIFNPTHTWIEYLNRLAGALAGVAVFVMAIFSFGYRKERTAVVIWLSWLVVLLMGFQAWLGATVVYSVLNPVKITLHMVVALFIVAIILYIIRKVSVQVGVSKTNRLFGALLPLSLLLTLIQIILGTQVRQFVDVQVKILGYGQMDEVLHQPTLAFYVHRSFSILVFILNVILFQMNRNKGMGYGKTGWILGILIAEIVSGIAMAYFSFPFGSQTIHLVLASVLFGLQFYVVMEYSYASNIDKKGNSKNL